MSTLKLTHVKKVYDNKVTAVEDFNLDVKDKEFIVFVGPSGCGKSTTLRMIAGLEDITDGTIEIDGKVVNDLQPKDRGIAMVFQNYALYPHLSVFENMAFPLRIAKQMVLVDWTEEERTELKSNLEKVNLKLEEIKTKPDYINREDYCLNLREKAEIEVKLAGQKVVYRKMDNDEIYQKVTQTAETLGITEYLMRKPRALSGGQRQRVAIGRAMVRDCKILLMDEPLSNLDAKLRNQMRAEIILLRKKIDSTFIYVTHDQTEAMTLGDRIVIMKDGKIMQVGSPQDVFERPKNLFVATFIGAPQMNLFDAKIMRDNNHFFLSLYGKNIEIDGRKAEELLEKDVQSQNIVVGIRPEHFVLAKKGDNSLEMNVLVNEMMGSEVHVHGIVGDKNNVIVRIPTMDLQEVNYLQRFNPGNEIFIGFSSKELHFFDTEGNNILYNE